MQPLGGQNSSGNAENGPDHLGAVDFARLQKAPGALQRFIYRSFRSFKPKNLVQAIANRPWQCGFATALVVAVSAYGFSAERTEAGIVASLTSQAGFEASKLVVNGSENLELDILKHKLAAHLGTSLFDFDVDAARQQVMSSSWVKHAEVRKVYPDTIVVDLVERKPVALWKADGVMNIISTEGLVIAEAGMEHMRLPQVVGRGANNAAAEFLSFINKYSDITSKARAYVRVGERRWNIHLDNGPQIMLPERDWKIALAELQELQSEKQIFERDIVQVDMRLADRLVLKMSPEQAKLRKTAIEEALKKKWHKI